SGGGGRRPRHRSRRSRAGDYPAARTVLRNRPRRRRISSRVAHRSVLAVALIALGCGGARSSAVGPDASAEHRDEAADARATPNDEAAGSLRQETLADRGWAMVQSRAVGLRVPLPDARAWSELDEERWFALTHEPSSSSLRFRTWRAPLRVSKDDCREQVYLWRSELRPRGEPMIEKSLGAPSGYDVGMRIDVERGQSGAFTAVLLAYGAG